MAYQLALLTAVSLIGGLIDLPAEWIATFRVEQRFGFNRMTPAALVGRPGQGRAARRAAIGLPLAALVLWIMAASGGLWWLWAWGALVGFNLLMLVLYPTVIAPLFNKFEPLADAALAERVQGAHAALRLRRQGPVRDGRQPPLGARQRLLHRAWRSQARGVLRHAAATSSARRGGGRAGARAGPLQAAPRVKTMLGMFAGSAWRRWRCWAGWRARAASTPDWACSPTWPRPTTRWRCCCSCWCCRASRFFVSPLMAQFSRRHEFQADAFACQQADGRDARQRLAQAARRQRQHADARPAVRALLLLAPAGQRTPRRPALAGRHLEARLRMSTLR
jgi:STE24 endopeptidase